jgi:hypothetical protein
MELVNREAFLIRQKGPPKEYPQEYPKEYLRALGTSKIPGPFYIADVLCALRYSTHAEAAAVVQKIETKSLKLEVVQVRITIEEIA